MFDCSDCDRFKCKKENTDRPKHEAACFYSYSKSSCVEKIGINRSCLMHRAIRFNIETSIEHEQ